MKALKFNEQMAQAVKDGRKTQTRRPMKPQPIEENKGYFTWFSEWGLCVDTSFDNLFQQILENEYGPYKIGDTNDVDGTLIKITDIRVERLHDISIKDCVKEGTPHQSKEEIKKNLCSKSLWHSYKDEVWNKLPYQPPYDWNSNPWVWVIEFEKVG